MNVTALEYSTLFDIAVIYCRDVSRAAELSRLNDIPLHKNLFAGQQIKLPADIELDATESPIATGTPRIIRGSSFKVNSFANSSFD